MKRRKTRGLVTLEATAAVLCFGGGILSGLVGTLLSASAWILGSEQHPWVRGLGTGFLVVTIPLLILAGYCMDWWERDSKKAPKPASRTTQQTSQTNPGFRDLQSHGEIMQRTLTRGR